MRIGVLAHLHYPIAEPYLGGLETHTAQVCEQLAQRGHQVTLYGRSGSRVNHPAVRVVDVLGMDPSWSPPPATGEDARLDRALEVACRLAKDQDVVLNNSLSPVPYTALHDAAMLTVLHTPATLERVNEVVESPGWKPGRRHAWVSVSAANAAGWRCKLRDVPVGVVHNGIDLGKWAASGTATQQLAWSARITPEKGLHVAIPAALATGIPLVVAGPVSNRDYYEEQIRPLVDGRQVRYAGHLPHAALQALLRDSAVFLCTPLWEEPFGLAPLEAMACGTPVAALGRGALPELVGDFGGVTVDAPADLPAAVDRALNLDRVGVRRRAEHFDMASMVDGYVSILERLRDAPR